jgi:hypothetical protein
VAERTREENAEDSVVSLLVPHVVCSRREWHDALAAPVVLGSSQRCSSSSRGRFAGCGGEGASGAAWGGDDAKKRRSAAEVVGVRCDCAVCSV